jgi:hypothetical protein
MKGLYSKANILQKQFSQHHQNTDDSSLSTVVELDAENPYVLAKFSFDYWLGNSNFSDYKITLYKGKVEFIVKNINYSG